MCFGNRLLQTNETPKNNNYCGGFAVAAVLNDNSGMIRNPKIIYDQIQDVQNQSLEGSSVSSKFIEGNIIEGTSITLPSSIVKYLKNEDRNVMVYYTLDIIELFTTRFFEEELEKLKNIGIQVNMIDKVDEYVRLLTDSSYHIILVNGIHWMAIKIKDDKNYEYYDPAIGAFPKADGISNVFKNIEDSLKHRISGLFICIKK